MKEMALGRGRSNADEERAAIGLGGRGQRKPRQSTKKQKGHISVGKGKAWEVTVKGSWSQEHQSRIDVLGALLGIPRCWPAGQGRLESMREGF